MRDDDKPTEVTFLIEEYRNIATTHDRLRDLLTRLFNYFLLLSAFPFTVAGIMFRQGEFDLRSAPMGLHFLFLVVGVGHLFLTLSLVDARLGQYRYARTVNAIRKYFADNAPGLDAYLYLPTDPDVPSWENLGYVRYQVMFMNVVGAVFATYGLAGLGRWLAGKWAGVLVGLVVFGMYFLAYRGLSKKILLRFQQHKGIN